ncbi:3-deoxy-D-manno-octulosonic acid transferase [Thalassococcus sp. BH17M4-6]|uniref:3-deoxy-D-manno-octulosonic acid transferase n=1 Tax=Thalassococcus sp. BH17M4-6 TaxID=3413148 RepID=UPI003BE27EDC
MLLYRLLISVFAVWQGLRLLLRGDTGALTARLGGTRPDREAPHLWLHAASNGELSSARAVIDALRDARPDLPLLITCNSRSGVDLARGWGHAAQLAPFDLAWAVRRMLRRWRIAAHITMETEIWPNRVRLCPGPVLVLGARMTERTARGWGRLPGLAARTLNEITYLSAQDTASLERFRALGLPDSAAGPVVDLKAFYTPPADQVPDAALRAAYSRTDTWLAASTHEGEDEVVIAAHIAARAHRPGLRLILAPRHPRRGDEVAALLSEAGLATSRRSAGEMGAEVLLADSLGEMARWYALAGTVFIAGTLTDRGGHTPYEPAAFGAALIHGPDVRNFRAAFTRLHAAGAAIRIDDAATLAEALIALKAPADQENQGAAAHRALAQATGSDELIAHVLDHLPRH